MNESALVALVVGVFGGGGLSQLIQAIESRRKGVRDQDVAADQHALNALVTTVETLRAEVSRLDEARRDDIARSTARADEQDRRITDLIAENRLYRRVVLGVVDRLRRIPPLDAAEVIGYIAAHIPLDDETPTVPPADDRRP